MSTDLSIPEKPQAVCKAGDFVFAAAELEHVHVYGQCEHLAKAGGVLKWVYDKDPLKVGEILKRFPGTAVARSLDEILDDKEVRLVTAAGVPSERAATGIKVMKSGKDYFVDKTPFTSLEHVAAVRKAVAETGMKYMVNYGERIGNEAAIMAGYLIERGAIGKVVHVLGLGPHKLGVPSSRPDWFYKKELYGGIICDIGSHQCEQFFAYTGAESASLNFARKGNFSYPEFPELEDFGEASIKGENGASFYFRVDWLTPEKFRSWGDGRTVIMGTKGTIELRKNIDICTENGANQLYLFNNDGEFHLNLNGQVGCPYFGQLILDCLNRTEKAMTQHQAILAGETAVKLQMLADSLS